MTFWEMIDRNRKRKSLLRLREDYLVAKEHLEALQGTIFKMGWSIQQETDHFMHLESKKKPLIEAIKDLEQQIKQL